MRRAAHALIGQNNAFSYDHEGHPVPFGEGDGDQDKEIRESFPNWSTMSEVEKVAAMETEHIGCVPENNDKEWSIARSHAQWSASGTVWTHRLCGYYVSFELPLHTKFAAPAAGPISLDVIKYRITIEDVPDLKTIKGVKDLFWSPNYEFLVVIINTDKACISNAIEICSPRESDPNYLDQASLLQVYEPHGQDLGKPVISMPLKEFEGPVMEEWATGSSVARWTSELMKIKAQGVVKPLLSSSPQP